MFKRWAIIVLAMLAIAFAITNYFLQPARRFEEFIFSVLKQEMAKACSECDIQYQDMDINLSSLRMKVFGLHLLRKGVVEARVNEMEAVFGLHDLFSGIVHLNFLALKEGFIVEDTKEKTALYLFIDQLTKPGISKPLIKLLVDHIEIKTQIVANLEMSQVITSAKFVVDRRDSKHDFRLDIRDLYYNKGSKSFLALSKAIATGSLGVETPEGNRIIVESFDGRLNKSRMVLADRLIMEPSLKIISGGSLTGALYVEDLFKDKNYLGLLNFNAQLGRYLDKPLIYGHGDIKNFNVVKRLSKHRQNHNFYEPDLCTLSYLTYPQLQKPINFCEIGTIKTKFDLDHDGDRFVAAFNLRGESDFFKHAEINGIYPDKKGTVLLDVQFLDQAIETNPIDILGVNLPNGEIRVKAKRNTVKIIVDKVKFDFKKIFYGDGSFTLEMTTDLKWFSIKGYLRRYNRFNQNGSMHFKWSTGGNLRVESDRYPILIKGSEYIISGGLQNNSIKGNLILPDFYKYFGLKGSEYDLEFTVDDFDLDDFVINYGYADEKSFKGSATVKGLTLVTTQVGAVNHSFLPCFRSSLQGNYTLNLVEYGQSGGQIENLELFNECGNGDQFKIDRPIKIEQDVIVFSGHNFLSERGNFSTTGNLTGDGASVRLIIDSNLRNLLYFPSLSLSGKLHGSLAISGPYDSLDYRGQLSIRRASLMGDKLSIQRIKGDVLIENSRFIPSNFTFGYLGNEVSVGGFYDLYQSDQSNFQLNSKFELGQNGWQITGDTFIKLNFRDEKIVVGGDVEISDIVYAKKITVKQILADLIDRFFSKEQSEVKKKVSVTNMVLLDLSLKLPHTKFISYFAKGILNGEVAILGSLDTMRGKGEVDVEEMIFGLKNVRFVSNEGKFKFRHSLFEPDIRFIGESRVITPAGKKASVLVEVEGSPMSPRIRFTSDLGLSESEIVQLLAFNTNEKNDTSVLGLDYQVKLSESRWINFLTSIDNVSIDPYFNPFTSSFDPRISARKNIVEDLDLYAARVFSDTFPSSDISLKYSLTDKMSIIQSLRLLPGQNALTPESDLEFWLYGKDQEFRIKFKGNDYFSDSELMELLILPKVVSERALRSIEKRLFSYYQDNGFHNVIVLATLVDGKIEVLINEQEQIKIKTLKSYPQFSGRVASTKNLSELEQLIRRECIRDYPNCSVRVRYRNGKLRIRKRFNSKIRYEILQAELSRQEKLDSLVLNTIEQLERFSPQGIKEAIFDHFFRKDYLDVQVTYSLDRGNYRFDIKLGKKASYQKIEVNNRCDNRRITFRKVRAISSYQEILAELFPYAQIDYNLSDKLEFLIVCPNLVREVRLPERLKIYEEANDVPKSLRLLPNYFDNLLAAIKEDGYPNARLSYRNDDGIVTVKVEFEDAQLIDKINVPSELEQYMVFKVGDRFGKNPVNRTIDTIYQTQRYKDVEVDIVEENGKNVVNVTAKRKKNKLLKLGFGYNSGYGIHLFSEASRKDLSLRNDFYIDRQSGEITFGSGNLIKQYELDFQNLNFIQDFGFQKLKNFNTPYDATRFSVVNYIDNGSASSFGHSLTFDNVDADKSSVLSNLDTGALTISKMQFKLDLDRRDGSLLPSSGYTLKMNLKASADILGSDANFFGGDISFSRIYPLTFDFNYSHLARVGYLHSFNGTDYVPITERYLLGGRSNVRGYRENRLGPTIDGAILGGEWLTQTSNQVGYKLNSTNEIYSFLDSGNVGVDNFSLSQRFSIGIGYQYLSLVGPIGLALASPLGERSGEPSVRLHFSFGSKY